MLRENKQQKLTRTNENKRKQMKTNKIERKSTKTIDKKMSNG